MWSNFVKTSSNENYVLLFPYEISHVSNNLKKICVMFVSPFYFKIYSDKTHVININYTTYGFKLPSIHIARMRFRVVSDNLPIDIV